MAKNASSSKAAAAAPAQENNFPLFFRAPHPLDMKRHAKAGLLPTQDLSFAATTNSILLNAAEFYEAAKHYPIVFTDGNEPMPAAIVGLEQTNYFVGAKGAWKEGAYLPAYVRKYPFVFMDVPERNEFFLCVDEAAPQFKPNGGAKTMPLYNGESPAELSLSALEFCTTFHNHNLMTRRFCDDIKAAGLLKSTRSNTKLSNGREIHLSGFLAIDEQKLQALPDTLVLDFFKKGWLPLIYTALTSTSNWKPLADMAALEEQAKTAR